jgi:NADH-quinone oxidoreductase subunit E
VALTEDTRLRAREIVARYPRSRSALLPMLHLVQAEEGYVSPEGIGLCAEELGLTMAEVGAVATFYTMYKRRPAGDWLVSVCTNTVCGMLGGDAIFQAVSEQLGVGHDQTTPDGTITLEHAECLAACDYAPVVTVNYEFYDNQSTESATTLVDELRGGARPAPSRGAPLCTFREISRQLAGFPDARSGAVGAGPAGEPTLVGARLAAQRLQTAPAYPHEKPDGQRAGAGSAAAAEAAGAGRPQPSSHDAPLPTAASNPDNPTHPTAPSAGPAGRKGD